MCEKTYDCLVAAGTTEAREAIMALCNAGYCILATVATELGAKVLQDLKTIYEDNLDIEIGRKDAQGFSECIQKSQIKMIIDATHPFAKEVTDTLKAVCAHYENEGIAIGYIRYLREMIDYDYTKIIRVPDAVAAANMLSTMPGRFLLTTGANTIDVYMNTISDFNSRGFVRVLDTKVSIERCEAFGVADTHVIAKNPPFSEADNISLLKNYNIQILVSKDSGKSGGLPEKINAAKKLDIPVILIQRPEDAGGVCTPDTLMKEVKRQWIKES